VHGKFIQSGFKGRVFQTFLLRYQMGVARHVHRRFSRKRVSVGDADQATERVVAVCTQTQLPSSQRRPNARGSLSAIRKQQPRAVLNLNAIFFLFTVRVKNAIGGSVRSRHCAGSLTSPATVKSYPWFLISSLAFELGGLNTNEISLPPTVELLLINQKSKLSEVIAR
jgi:hypothetical protein